MNKAALIGTEVGGYRIVSELGAGGMGTVFLAEEAVTGRRAAVKIVHPHLLSDPDFFERFRREAEIGQRIEDDNVVRTLGAGTADHGGVPLHFMIMEYVEGQTLRGLVEELGRVPEELCRHVGREVARALTRIHEAGIVHRDLKPENVLITREHVIKVMDLGLARLQDEAVKLSRTGQFVGSLLYASPEQFTVKTGDLDGRADLYSLGLVLYELSTGTHPFRDDEISVVIRRQLQEEPRRPGELNPQLSPFFEELVLALIVKDRDRRFPSARQLLTVLLEGEKSLWWEKRAGEIRATTKRPLRRMRVPRETALHGREKQLEALHAAWQRVREGRGQVVLVGGEAGAGKTRLVDEFVAIVERKGEDPGFLFGSYPPGGAATGLAAFATAYREHLGAEGLEETLKGHLPSPALAPAFAALLKGEPPPPGTEPLAKEQIQTLFTHVTRSIARERPAIVVIDDLHFADDHGRALFAALTLALRSDPVLLIGTMRRGLPEQWIAELEREDHVSRLAVDRLGPKDLTRLLRDALGSANVADQLAAKIAIKSDGNPFFVFEILRGLREGRFLKRRADGSWISTSVIREIEIPSTVIDLVRGRLADLEDEDRDLLDVAACCGFEFDPALVGDVLGMRSIATLKRLARLEERKRLVRCVGERYVFDHHQAQETIYTALSPPLRREYHAELARVLEEREEATGREVAGLDRDLVVSICDHYLKGSKGEEARRYLEPALAHLEAGYRPTAAVEMADRALEMKRLLEGPERAQILLRKASPLNLLGRREEERAALVEAVALADASEDPLLKARAHRALGLLHSAVSEYERSREELNRALDMARAAGSKVEEAAATQMLGNLFQLVGEFEPAREHFEKARELAREIGNRGAEAVATNYLGLVHFSRGMFEEARRHYDEGLALARELGNRRLEANATGNLGAISWALGRHEETRVHWERQLEIAREISDRRAEARGTLNLGMVLFALGRIQAAKEHMESALDIAREIGNRQSEALALTNLADLHAALGNLRVAKKMIEETRGLLRVVGARRLEGYMLHALGNVAEREGDPGAARARYEEALHLRREIRYPSGVAATLLALGRLHLAEKRPAEAQACLQEALGIGRSLESPETIVRATAYLALLPEADAGAAREALTAHESRLPLSDKMEARFLLWKATREPEHLKHAHRLLEHLRDHAPTEYKDSMMRNVSVLGEIESAWAAGGPQGLRSEAK